MEGISLESPPLLGAAAQPTLGQDFRRAVRAVPAAVRTHVFRLATLVFLPLALLAGLFIGWSLKAWVGFGSSGQPYHLIAGSIVLNLLLLSTLLMWLPRRHDAWQFIFSWIAWALCSAAAFAGLWLSGAESLRTFATLWLLTIGQGAMLSACGSIASVLFSGRMQAGRQVAAVILAAAVTAIFWTKTPIQTAVKDESAAGASMSDMLYDATLRLSPPLAVCGAWFQESDVSRSKITTENSRFDLVHGPLSYGVWMGSYPFPYPEIMPGKSATKNNLFCLGVALTLLVWALPVMLLADLLLAMLMLHRARTVQAAHAD